MIFFWCKRQSQKAFSDYFCPTFSPRERYELCQEVFKVEIVRDFMLVSSARLIERPIKAINIKY